MFKPLRQAGAAALCVALLGDQLRRASAADLKSGLKIAFVPEADQQPVRGDRRRRRHGRDQGD